MSQIFITLIIVTKNYLFFFLGSRNCCTDLSLQNYKIIQVILKAQLFYSYDTSALSYVTDSYFNLFRHARIISKIIPLAVLESDATL